MRLRGDKFRHLPQRLGNPLERPLLVERQIARDDGCGSGSRDVDHDIRPTLFEHVGGGLGQSPLPDLLQTLSTTPAGRSLRFQSYNSIHFVRIQNSTVSIVGHGAIVFGAVMRSTS